MSGSRFIVSLVAVLSSATLALADSAPVNVTFLHPGISAYRVDYASPANLFTGQASTSTDGNAHFSGLIPARITYAQASRFAVPDGIHDNITFRARNWAGPKLGGGGTSTPEPGSLLLLSTGLIGIAEILRRKLRA